MQKFTRPLTREIELAGERLALTLDERGISIRPVGSRKPPREITWAEIIHQCAQPASPPTGQVAPEQLAQAVQALKTSTSSQPARPAAPPETQGGVSRETRAPAVHEMTTTLARLEKWLGQHRPRYLKSLRPGAAPADLDSLQSQLGVPLPADLRALLTWHNGQGDEPAGCFEESWNLMSTSEIAEAKRSLDTDGRQKGWQPGWIPCLDDDVGDYLCLDSASGVVREFWQDRPEHPEIAPSLKTWLERFVTAMEHGEYDEDPERGYLLRRQA